jgi:hypothetical protein
MPFSSSFDARTHYDTTQQKINRPGDVFTFSAGSKSTDPPFCPIDENINGLTFGERSEEWMFCCSAKELLDTCLVSLRMITVFD